MTFSTDRFGAGIVRKMAISLVLASTLLAATFGVATTIPEHILFRQRTLFNLLELDSLSAVQPLDYETHDGLTIRAWYLPAVPGKPTIVYFAGREGDLVRKPRHLYEMAENGYGLLLAGYRGYGGNPGRPREGNMYRDAAAMLDQAEQAGLARDGFVLYGYSMGSGIATNAAAQIQPRALILEAPMTSFPEAVRQQVARVPNWVVRTKFDNVARLAELKVPVLIVAGEQDPVTPARFATMLASVNDQFATAVIVPAANHVNIIRLGGRQAVASFMEQFDESGILASLSALGEQANDIADSLLPAAVD